MSFGVLIPGCFGLAWIAFAGSGVAPGWIIASAIAAVVMLVVAGARSRSRQMLSAGSLISRSYWAAIAFEVVAALVGVLVIGVADLSGSAVRGWIEVVVGLHFFILSWAWMRRLNTYLSLLGVLFVAAGMVALVASLCGASQSVIAVFGGLVPGLLLAAWSLLATYQKVLDNPQN